MLRVPSTDGVVLALHEFGPGGPDLPPLLLAHATGFHAYVWRALATEFPDRRSLAVDFRGFGDSTQPADVDWWDYAHDVLAVLDATGLSGIQAVGHSMGGASLLMAEMLRPGSFEALVCFEPIVFPANPPRPEGTNPLAEVTRHRRETFSSYEEAIERFGAKPPLGTLRPDVLEDYVRHGFDEQPDGTIRLKASREHEARTYEMGSTHGAFERLHEVQCPVLVVQGNEAMGPAAIAPLVAAALPQGTLHRYDDLSHFGPLDDPTRFGQLVREFLS